MKQYIGTKLIEAEPAYRCTDGSGKVVITPRPEEAFPNYPSIEDGYRVRYPDAVCLLEPEGGLRGGVSAYHRYELWSGDRSCEEGAPYFESWMEWEGAVRRDCCRNQLCRAGWRDRQRGT